MTDLVPIAGELVSEDDYLEQLASRVRVESKNLKLSMTDSVESMFIIGQCLNEARAALNSNEAYGAWFSAQNFAFTTQWGLVLRQGALNEPLVRPALASQLANGNKAVNFEKAVKETLGTSKPKPVRKSKPDYKALAEALADVLRDIEQFMTIDEETRAAIVDALAAYDKANG